MSFCWSGRVRIAPAGQLHRLRRGYWCQNHLESGREPGLERPPLPVSRQLEPGQVSRSHQSRTIRFGIIRRRLEYPIDHALLNPAIIASLLRLIGTEPFGQVTLAPARTGQPQQGADKAPADKPSPMADWIRKLSEKKTVRLASVALANKWARIAWVVLTREEAYHPYAPLT